MNLPRWAWFMVVGFILFVIQVNTPDLVDEFINGFLQNPTSLSFTGVVPLLKVSLFIWNISGIALFVSGIVMQIFYEGKVYYAKAKESVPKRTAPYP